MKKKYEDLVSIIIPVYNVEKYIDACIYSVKNQSYTNLEIIIIDDGSTDCSGKICDEYAVLDSRIIVVHQENKGLSCARNVGLNMCTGEYIFFLDSDDCICWDTIERLLIACKNHNAELVICGIIFDNALKKRYFCKEENIIFDDNFSLMKAYVSEKFINNVVWNKLYSKRLLEKIRFYPNIKNEDVIFTAQILSKVNKAIYINNCLYIQNIRNGSLERSDFTNDDLDILFVMQKRQEIILQKYEELSEYIKFDCVTTIISLMKKILMAPINKKNKETYKELERKLVFNLSAVDEIDKKAYNEYYFPIKHAWVFKFKFYFIGRLRKAKMKLIMMKRSFVRKKNLYEKK